MIVPLHKSYPATGAKCSGFEDTAMGSCGTPMSLLKKAAERLSHQPSDLACYTQKRLNIVYRTTQVILLSWRTAALVRQRLVGALLNPAQ